MGPARGLLCPGGMGTADMSKLWMYLADLEERVARPEVETHEESDLHRVFCDEHFCLDREAVDD